MAYRLELSPRASRDLRKLPARVQERLKDQIDALADAPRPRGVTKLQGETNTYRIRVGDYRVLYEVHDQILVVIVLKVADRKEAYRQGSNSARRRPPARSRTSWRSWSSISQRTTTLRVPRGDAETVSLSDRRFISV